MSTLNEAVNGGKMTQDQYEDVLEMMWVPMVRRFVEKWGVDKVMNDVRHALNDVERNLEIDVTTFNN